MKKVRIYYSTPYSNSNKVNGYVVAKDYGDYVTINEKQAKRAYNNLTIGGNVSPFYHTRKGVYIEKNGFVKW